MFALFTLLSLGGILNHAMWRDEVNVWLIVRDSTSFSELLQTIKYEGHPVLWYFCLWGLNQVTDNPVIMQLFHWGLAVSTVYLFLQYAPFSRLQKGLFIFGYYPFYEYCLISRNYAFSLLFLFVFCVLFQTRQNSYLGLAITLFFLANSNAYGLILSFALFLMLILDYFWSSPDSADSFPPIWDMITSGIIYIIGVIFSTWVLIPPLDSQLQGGLTQWFIRWDFYHLMKVLSRLWSSSILILIPGDSNVLAVTLFGLISLSVFVFFIGSFLRKPIPLFFYSIATVKLWLFAYLKFLGSPRHYGYIFLVLIVALWLSHYYQTSEYLPQKITQITSISRQNIKQLYRWIVKSKHTVILIILIAQLIAGLIAFGRDLIIPFSAARQTASYIKQEKLDELFMVGSEDFAMAAISGYLNQKIYYPEIKKLGSFTLFTRQRQSHMTQAEIIADVRHLLDRPNISEILLILNEELQIDTRLQVEKLAQFTESFIHNEQYYLYRVKKSSGVVKTPELN